MISPCGLQWFFCAGDSHLPNTLITLAGPRQLQAPTGPQPLLCQRLFRSALHTRGCSTGLGAQLLSAPHSPNAQLSEGLDIQSSDNRALARLGSMSRRGGAQACPMEITEYRLDPVAHLQSKSRVHPRSHKDKMEPFGTRCLTHDLVFCLQIHWGLCLNEHRGEAGHITFLPQRCLQLSAAHPSSSLGAPMSCEDQRASKGSPTALSTDAGPTRQPLRLHQQL